MGDIQRSLEECLIRQSLDSSRELKIGEYDNAMTA